MRGLEVVYVENIKTCRVTLVISRSAVFQSLIKCRTWLPIVAPNDSFPNARQQMSPNNKFSAPFQLLFSIVVETTIPTTLNPKSCRGLANLPVPTPASRIFPHSFNPLTSTLTTFSIVTCGNPRVLS